MSKISKTCPICNNVFYVNKCHSHRFRTCSYKCGGIYRSKPIIKNICKKCGIEFVSKKTPTRSQDFCSTTCSLKSRKKSIEKQCVECGEKFEIPQYKVKKGYSKFCKNSCRLKNWNKKSMEGQKPGTYRQNAWRCYEKKCYDCGFDDSRVLVIHHIDGNRKNGKLANLVPLCHNCHCIRHIIMSGNHRLPSYRGND